MNFSRLKPISGVYLTLKPESLRTPLRTRAIYSSQIARMKIKLRDKTCSPTDNIKIRVSDPSTIKQIKELANRILSNRSNEKFAWRIDYAVFFERFVQYLLTDVSKKKGVRPVNNPHYGIRVSKRPSWAINYLEPDMIIQKGDEQFVVDAKYKSHLFNWNNNSEELKNTFRHDLHQLLAYCSMNGMNKKQALLIYPFSDFTCREISINSCLATTEIQVYMIGIPLNKNRVEDTQSRLNKIINFSS